MLVFAREVEDERFLDGGGRALLGSRQRELVAPRGPSRAKSKVSTEWIVRLKVKVGCIGMCADQREYVDRGQNSQGGRISAWFFDTGWGGAQTGTCAALDVFAVLDQLDHPVPNFDM